VAEPLAAVPPPNSEAERRLVLDHVRRDWINRLGTAACEDAVSEAYRALLECSGDAPRNRVGWLCTAAWRAANDEHKRARHQSVDGSRELARLPGHDAPPEEQIDFADVEARLRLAFHNLPDELRTAYASKHTRGVTVDQACRRLGCPRSTLMHRRARALQELYAVARGTSERFEDAFVSMATAVLSGSATREDRRHLRDLVSKSPYYAARYAEIKRLDGNLGALVPPVALQHDLVAGVVDRATAAIGKARDVAHQLLSRSPESAEAATSSVAASTAKAGGATAGGLGGAIGLGGGAAKLALTCGGAAAAAACVAVVAPGVGIPGSGDRDPEVAPQRPTAVERVAKGDVGVTATPTPDVLPGQVGNEGADPVTAEPAPTEPSNSQGDQEDPAAAEPAPAQESATADFSYGSQTASPPAPEPASPETSSATSGTSRGSSGGSQEGDFAFGQ